MAHTQHLPPDAVAGQAPGCQPSPQQLREMLQQLDIPASWTVRCLTRA